VTRSGGRGYFILPFILISSNELSDVHIHCGFISVDILLLTILVFGEILFVPNWSRKLSCCI
jgi:low temperature requirement protein LtrA